MGIFFAPKTKAAIIFDASSTVGFKAVSAVTSTITVGTGSNQLLVISIGTGDNFTIVTSTIVTVDGVSATLAVQEASVSTRISSVWYITGISSGVHNVTTTFSGSTQGMVALSSFFGAKQSSLIDSVATSAASSNNPSTTIFTIFSNDLIVDGTGKSLVRTTTGIGSGQVSIAQDVPSSVNLFNGNSSYNILTTLGSTNISYTLSGSSAYSMSVVAFEAAPITTYLITGGSTTIKGASMVIN